MKDLKMKDFNMGMMCSFFGHSYRFNFPYSSHPNRTICARCKGKWELNIETSEWLKVDKFSIKNDNRTDEELIKKWFE